MELAPKIELMERLELLWNRDSDCLKTFKEAVHLMKNGRLQI
jgi:hypothetical protein